MIDLTIVVDIMLLCILDQTVLVRRHFGGLVVSYGVAIYRIVW